MIYTIETNILHLTNYTFTGYCFPPFFVAILSVFVGIFVLLHENFSKTSIIFSIMVLFNGPIWFGSNAFMISANDLQTAMFWFRVHHLGYIPIPTILLLFTLFIRNNFQKFKYVFWSFVVINLFFLYLATFTDILIIGAHRFTWGYYPAYGILGVIHILIFSFMLCFNIFLYIQGFLEAGTDSEKLRMKLFIISIMIGSLASVNFVAYFNVPLYPFGCLFIFAFFILFAKGILQYNLINIEPEMASSQIIKTMSDILIITNLDGLIQIINPAAEEFLHLPERNIIGKHLSVFLNDTFFHLNDGETFIQKAQSVKIHEISYGAGAEGNMILNLSVSVLKDSSDKAIGIVFTAKDRTGYKKLHDDIKKAYSVTQMILEKVPVGIIILSLDKKIKVINKIAVKMMGLEDEKEVLDTIPENLSDFLDSENDSPVFSGESKEIIYETTITNKNVRKIHVLKSIIRMDINDEDVFLEAFVDITKRKRLEDEILGYKDYLEEQVQERTGKLQIVNKQLLSEVKICEDISRHLKEKLEILERFKEETVSREQEMIEIKKVINDFSIKLNRRPPYSLSFLK